MRLGEPVARQNFELELYLILAATALLATFWRKIRRLFRRQRRGLDGVAHDERTDSSVDEEGDEASPRRLQQSPTSSRRRSNFGGSSAPSIPAMEHLQAPTTNRFDPDMELEGFVDDINDTSTTAPEWYDGPRDETTLPAIIASIYSDNTEEADFALKQTLSILETMEPKSHFPVFVDALQAIGNLLPPIIKDPDIGVPWSGILDLVREDPSTAGVRLSPNMAQILLDGLPSLFELVTNNEPLNRFRDVLSLFISISICTESYGNGLAGFSLAF
ncbi:unnamed protein product [Caenorhabditis auriculariae]|uniref:Uncharacterized protein n=1 Tax=Caenorhabditis auriculariae TaxID=2777116 RepID=A0A8S1H2Q4_9PELO|nr:unnamed protein product [Caenorhabditis auriculariae]